MKAISHKQ